MSRLERWSRRKRGLDAEPTSHAAAETTPAAPPPDESAPVDEPAAHDADAPLDDTLPDPESLPPGSDFSRYLQEGVSQVLRRRALRRLWQAEHYQVRDGLDDYDGDYSQLEPMAREVAEQLRHWSRKVGDVLEPDAEGGDPSHESPADSPSAETEAETPDESAQSATPTGRDQGGIGHISDYRQD